MRKTAEKLPSRRFSTAPLQEYARETGLGDAPLKNLPRLRRAFWRDHVGYETIDKLCVAFNLHPTHLYPEFVIEEAG